MASRDGLRRIGAGISSNAAGLALGWISAPSVIQESSAGCECEDARRVVGQADYGDRCRDRKAFRREHSPAAEGRASEAARGDGEFRAGREASKRKYETAQ